MSVIEAAGVVLVGGGILGLWLIGWFVLFMSDHTAGRFTGIVLMFTAVTIIVFLLGNVGQWKR